MALRPAASAGLISLLGLLPTIQLVRGDNSWRWRTSRWVFFCDDLNCREVTGKAGTFQLVSLLGVVAFGHEDEPVACGQLGQGLGHAGEQLNLLLGDGAGEAFNALALFVGHGRGAEPREAVYQRASETRQAISMGEDSLAFDGVQRLSDLGGRVPVVIQITYEGGDGALEVNIVLPQRIVGIDEQRLSWCTLLHESYLSESGWCGLRRRVRYTKFRTRRSHVMGAGVIASCWLGSLAASTPA